MKRQGLALVAMVICERRQQRKCEAKRCGGAMDKGANSAMGLISGAGWPEMHVEGLGA